MITPSFSLTATERVLPRLALDFTTAALDPRVTFTRLGNTATVTNSSGVIALVNANIPRFDYNPTTLVCNGLLIEESRTNVLLNSLIDGTSLGTQVVTVTAAARTLSFYGTGQVVLSGAHSATVTGTGAYPARTTLTFTPSAGVLTLTVTGTVQFAQLETGSFATSFIPTAASQVTRNADYATMQGANLSSWLNTSEGAFVVSYGPVPATSTRVVALWASDSLTIETRLSSFVIFDTTLQANIATTGYLAGAPNKIAAAYKLNNSGCAVNGNAAAVDTSCNIPTGLTQFNIGCLRSGVAVINATIESVNYFPQRITNSELQAFSK